MGIVRKYRKRPVVVKAYQTDMATSPLKSSFWFSAAYNQAAFFMP